MDKNCSPYFILLEVWMTRNEPKPSESNQAGKILHRNWNLWFFMSPSGSALGVKQTGLRCSDCTSQSLSDWSGRKWEIFLYVWLRVLPHHTSRGQQSPQRAGNSRTFSSYSRFQLLHVNNESVYEGVPQASVFGLTVFNPGILKILTGWSKYLLLCWWWTDFSLSLTNQIRWINN